MCAYVCVCACVCLQIYTLLYALDYISSALHVLPIVVSGDTMSAAASLCTMAQVRLQMYFF